MSIPAKWALASQWVSGSWFPVTVTQKQVFFAVIINEGSSGTSLARLSFGITPTIKYWLWTTVYLSIQAGGSTNAFVCLSVCWQKCISFGYATTKMLRPVFVWHDSMDCGIWMTLWMEISPSLVTLDIAWGLVPQDGDRSKHKVLSVTGC